MHWYEWAFSGIGAAVLVFVGNAVFRKRSSGSIDIRQSPMQIESPGSIQTTAPVNGAILTAPVIDSQVAIGENISQTQEIHNHYTPADDGWKITEPAPSQLVREIEEALPFERRKATKRYMDLQVVWEGKLVSIDEDWRKKYQIMAVLDRECNLMSFAVTNISPEMRTATRNSILVVKGKVESVSSAGVHLQDDPEVRVIKRA